MAMNETQDKERYLKLKPQLREQYEFEVDFFSAIITSRNDYLEALRPLANALTELGFYKKGLEVDLRICMLAPKDSVAHYNLACSYALVGNKRDAFLMLRKAVGLGYKDFSHIRRDTDLRSLHGEPDFEAIFNILD
jgi:tetratricopeptide (TPR) repeat protein